MTLGNELESDAAVELAAKLCLARKKKTAGGVKKVMLSSLIA